VWIRRRLCIPRNGIAHAKPTAAERLECGAPPASNFSDRPKTTPGPPPPPLRFQRDAVSDEGSLSERGRQPLLVGGNDATLHGPMKPRNAELPEADPKVREDTRPASGDSGWMALQEELERWIPPPDSAHPCERSAADSARLEVIG